MLTNGKKPQSLPTTPVKTSSALKRAHNADNPSKFNRSIRKSDLQAIYYFKHPDTESENGLAKSVHGDCSSQDATSDIYSEDEQWVYSNGQPQCVPDEDELNGNVSFDLTNASMHVELNGSCAVDVVDSPAADAKVLNSVSPAAKFEETKKLLQMVRARSL